MAVSALLDDDGVYMAVQQDDFHRWVIGYKEKGGIYIPLGELDALIGDIDSRVVDEELEGDEHKSYITLEEIESYKGEMYGSQD